jgi:capsular polysaccharide biosynthesis protein
MEKYEKSIGLKTIYLTLVRRFHIILLLFVPIALGSFIVTNLIMKKTYQSSSTIAKTTAFTAAHYQNAQLTIKNETNLTKVADNLKNNGILHSNGTAITINEINSGLSFSAFNSSNQSVSLSLYFQSNDNKIVQPTLAELTTVSIETLKTHKDFETTYITKEATKAVKNSKENQYFLIALAAGAVVSLGIPFVYEIISDELYDADDVKMLGCDAFELKISGK